jgi:hypothetical protein
MFNTSNKAKGTNIAQGGAGSKVSAFQGTITKTAPQ